MIITSNEDIFNSETDEDDWHDRKSQDVYVLTKHAKILSGLFYYIKENIFGDRDNIIIHAFKYGTPWKITNSN